MIDAWQCIANPVNRAVWFDDVSALAFDPVVAIKKKTAKKII